MQGRDDFLLWSLVIRLWGGSNENSRGGGGSRVKHFSIVAFSVTCWTRSTLKKSNFLQSDWACGQLWSECRMLSEPAEAGANILKETVHL